MTKEGWEELGKGGPPRRRGPADRAEVDRLVRQITTVSPFTRLARVHATLAAGDASVAIGLAGSFFFDVSPDAARSRIAAYLLFSLAPFVFVAPLVGPFLDRVRGGRRGMVIGLAGVRVVLCVLMAAHLDTWLIFPEAFLTLLAQKSYAVSKSALVPTVVSSDEELVEANAKLGVLAGITGFAAALPAMFLQLVGPSATMLYGAVVFVVAFFLSLRLPKAVVASSAAGPIEKAELHAPGLLLAASAMGLLRATVGFLVFQTAFWFRREGVATVWFGIAVLASALGTFLGNLVATRLRRFLREEWMLFVSLGIPAVCGFVAAFGPSPGTAALVALAVGFSASVGRSAFDAIVQRDAPDANRGRAFAQFETRFQLTWVIAGAVPVIIPIPGGIGFLIVALIAASAAGLYLFGAERVRSSGRLPESVSARIWRRVKVRMALGRLPATDEEEAADQGEVQPPGEPAAEPPPASEAAPPLPPPRPLPPPAPANGGRTPRPSSEPRQPTLPFDQDAPG